MACKVYSNAVDPGWVPTKMGGAGAPDDLRLGHLTQEWLATNGDYCHHQRRQGPHPAANDTRFQGLLLADLAACAISTQLALVTAWSGHTPW